MPESAGVVSNDPDELVGALMTFIREPELALVLGKQARVAALESFGLQRFLSDWDRVLAGSSWSAPRRVRPQWWRVPRRRISWPVESTASKYSTALPKQKRNSPSETMHHEK